MSRDLAPLEEMERNLKYITSVYLFGSLILHCCLITIKIKRKTLKICICTIYCTIFQYYHSWYVISRNRKYCTIILNVLYAFWYLHIYFNAMLKHLKPYFKSYYFHSYSILLHNIFAQQILQFYTFAVNCATQRK